VVVAPGVVVLLEVGLVLPVTTVVVVTPPQVHALQALPHGPEPASHSSPPSRSQMPSPQALSDPSTGFTIPSALAMNVADSVRHCSTITPTSRALPSIPAQDRHCARTFVPATLPRTRAFTGPQPLSIEIMRPSTWTTSIGAACSIPVSGSPATR
jgi:hypothetical protein